MMVATAGLIHILEAGPEDVTAGQERSENHLEEDEECFEERVAAVPG